MPMPTLPLPAVTKASPVALGVPGIPCASAAMLTDCSSLRSLRPAPGWELRDGSGLASLRVATICQPVGSHSTSPPLELTALIVAVCWTRDVAFTGLVAVAVPFCKV